MDATRTTLLKVTHETEASTKSNIIHHIIKVGDEKFTFDEDTKVSIYVVNGNQIPRIEDAMIRALIIFQDQISAKASDTYDVDPLISAIETEIDRQVLARRRAMQH